MKKWSHWALAGLSILTACDPYVPYTTPSGRPETCIHNALTAQLASNIASELLNQGYTVTQQTDAIVRAHRQVTDVIEAVVFASDDHPTPDARETFNIIPYSECTRVVAEIEIVTDLGGDSEHSISRNHRKDSLELQHFLDTLKANYESKFPAR